MTLQGNCFTSLRDVLTECSWDSKLDLNPADNRNKKPVNVPLNSILIFVFWTFVLFFYPTLSS